MIQCRGAIPKIKMFAGDIVMYQVVEVCWRLTFITFSKIHIKNIQKFFAKRMLDSYDVQMHDYCKWENFCSENGQIHVDAI